MRQNCTGNGFRPTNAQYTLYVDLVDSWFITTEFKIAITRFDILLLMNALVDAVRSNGMNNSHINVKLYVMMDTAVATERTAVIDVSDQNASAGMLYLILFTYEKILNAGFPLAPLCVLLVYIRVVFRINLKMRA